MALIPIYTTPVPGFDLLNELNNIINLVNANFQQAQGAVDSYQTNSATASTTLLNTNVAQNGVIDLTLNLTGTLAAGGAATLPTVATLLQQLPQAQVGSTYKLRVINSSAGAFAWTVTTNTGWTLTGTMTIAQNTFRDFIVTITSVGSATATLQAVGTGTQS